MKASTIVMWSMLIVALRLILVRPKVEKFKCPCGG